MAKRKLPPKKTSGQVSAEVDRLFDSRPMQAYHRAIVAYRADALMRGPEGLPDSFDEGISMSLPSSRVHEVVHALLGKASGFVRYTDMVAKAERSGVPSQKLMAKADRGGRTLTVMNASLDAGKRVSRAMWGHQLVDGWCVLHLHRRGKPGRGFRWEVEVADPLTCAFPEQTGGAFVPTRLARKFTMLMPALQAMYAGRGKLSRGKTSGDFDWQPLSAPRALEEGSAFDDSGGSSDENGDVEVELLIYEDGDYVYHIVRNAGGGTNSGDDQTKVLYCAKNNTHVPKDDADDYEAECGAMAVVVPGDTLSYGGDGEKMLPVTFALINVVHNLNLLRAIRGRSAIKDTPNMVAAINATAEEFAELQKIGAVKPVDEEGGSGSVVYVAGKDISVTPWQLRANEDLDSLDLAMREDLLTAVGELLVNTDPALVATATASAYHISTGEVGQRHTGWLGNGDTGFASIDRMICNAVINDDDEYDFTASEPHPRSGATEVPKGSYLSLGPDDLDFPNDITVVTKQETEDQKNKRLLNAIFLKDQGIRTLINAIAEDTVDVTARVKELRVDYARRLADPVLMLAYFPAMLRNYIKDGAGVDLPLDERPELFTGVAPTAPAPNAQPTQSFAPAPVEPSVGGGEAGATL